MRILMLCWEFPPAIYGGLGVACGSLAEALGRIGHDVTVLVPCGTPETSDTVRVVCAADLVGESLFSISAPYVGGYALSRNEAAVDATAKNGVRRPLADAPGGDAQFALYGPALPVAVTTFALAARRLVGRETFDVVHCHDWMTVPAALAACEKGALRWVYHIHSLETDRVGTRSNRYIVKTEECGMRQADQLIAVSARQRGRIIRTYGVVPERIGVVHNAVPADIAWRPTPPTMTARHSHRRHVVLLGRVTWQKGPELFLAAAALVAERVKDVTFIVAGTGELLAELSGKVEQPALAERVEFRGFMSRTGVAELLRTTDILVMSSRREPFGLTALEAAAAGVPVVIPRTAGVCERLLSAATFEPGNAAELAQQMVRLLTDRTWARENAQRNRQHALSWSWTDAAKAVVKTYRRAMPETQA